MVPSKVDPSLTTQGFSCITLINLVPYEEAITWKRKDGDYAARKQQYGDKLIKLAEIAIPNLRQHIVYRQDASPATFARYAWTTGGSYTVGNVGDTSQVVCSLSSLTTSPHALP